MNDILTLLTSHNYLALALFALLYVRKLLSTDSKFPLSVPAQWLPAVTGLLGVGYEVVSDVQSHVALQRVVVDALAFGAATGVGDALLTAIFSSGNAPKWAKAIVFIFDDLSGASAAKKGAVSALIPFALAASIGLSQTSCAAGQKPLPDPIPQDLQAVVACVLPLLAEGVTDPAKLEASCAPGQDQLIIDVLALLTESKDLNPAVVASAKVSYVLGVRAFLKKHQSQFQLEVVPQ